MAAVRFCFSNCGKSLTGRSKASHFGETYRDMRHIIIKTVPHRMKQFTIMHGSEGDTWKRAAMYLARYLPYSATPTSLAKFGYLWKKQSICTGSLKVARVARLTFDITEGRPGAICTADSMPHTSVSSHSADLQFIGIQTPATDIYEATRVACCCPDITERQPGAI
jgi:hypothetical protein